MRQIVLDTETTGKDWSKGDRIIEVSCVELENRRYTGRVLQHYLNPEREIDAAAFSVHGISREFLSDKPKFEEIAKELIDFIQGSELIIHNAPFDVGFLNTELKRIQSYSDSVETYCTVVDSLQLARLKHPGERNSLDALCNRYEVNNSKRGLHGALLDARLLAEVYLLMTSVQEEMDFEIKSQDSTPIQGVQKNQIKLTVLYANKQECEAHEHYLEKIQETSGGKCLWLQKDTPTTIK